jgi:hypothetical protein
MQQIDGGGALALKGVRRGNGHKGSFEMEDFFLFSAFSCEIELFPVKFLSDSCEISVFQRRPKAGCAKIPCTHLQALRHMTSIRLL